MAKAHIGGVVLCRDGAKRVGFIRGEGGGGEEGVVEDEEGREDLSELDEVLDEDGAELAEEAKEAVRGNVGRATITRFAA